MNEKLLSERRAAKRTGVGRMTLRRHRAAGNIVPIVFDGLVLYKVSELHNWHERFTAGEFKNKEKRN
jgi:hypothetical protein